MNMKACSISVTCTYLMNDLLLWHTYSRDELTKGVLAGLRIAFKPECNELQKQQTTIKSTSLSASDVAQATNKADLERSICFVHSSKLREAKIPLNQPSTNRICRQIPGKSEWFTKDLDSKSYVIQFKVVHIGAPTTAAIR